MYKNHPQRINNAPGPSMPKFSGIEQQVSADPNGMTNISRPTPKLNMNSGALVGDMSMNKSRSNATLQAMRQQAQRKFRGQW